MLQIISLKKTKDLKHVQTHMDRWESKVSAPSGDFDEQLSERMKAAILIPTLPLELRDDVLQNPDKFCGVPADQGASHHHGGGEALGPFSR